MENLLFDVLWGCLALHTQKDTRYDQLVENICVYLQAENQLHRPCFSGDIAKVGKILTLDTLGNPGYAHPK